jgi:hypothetical protein
MSKKAAADAVEQAVGLAPVSAAARSEGYPAKAVAIAASNVKDLG